MTSAELIASFAGTAGVSALAAHLDAQRMRLQCSGMTGSVRALAVAAISRNSKEHQLVVVQDKEQAAFFLNDLENLFDEGGKDFFQKKILFFPSAFNRKDDLINHDPANVLMRTEVMNRLRQDDKKVVVVTWPEALAEKVVDRDLFRENAIALKKGQEYDLDRFVTDLAGQHFDRVDFVAEPGQFSVRGGIVDVFSFSNDKPFRVEFFGDTIDSLRSFDPVSQLSVDALDHLRIVPDMNLLAGETERVSLLRHIPKNSVVWIDDAGFMNDRMDQLADKAAAKYAEMAGDAAEEVQQRFSSGSAALREMLDLKVIEFGQHAFFTAEATVSFSIAPQPSFNKNFDLLIQQIRSYNAENYRVLILSDAENQLNRITRILHDLTEGKPGTALQYETLNSTLHEGFIDQEAKIAVLTDHQIFDRYHRFRLRDSYQRREAITLKEIYNLKPGDYVTHIDHGVGRYGGLEKIMVNGRQQEAIRLVYDNNDLLYVSIHSLHRISKYAGKDGAVPSLHRLGGNAWSKLKSKTKQKVKDIARDLIALYAKRRNARGYAFSPDSFLQTELEASFIYQDTPDQTKCTQDVKRDMEAENPMDRLICGDVGFGKTEIAVRAAFKAVNDSKQVAVLVPTTILALQHYHTFQDRLAEFPCRVEYLNRFKTSTQQKQILKDLKDGRIDILIGTHRLLGKDIQFDRLGLLVIDEEQKFGVAAKEKLRQIKVNVDTLTLTATPIPRTLQFSLMGARDLSVINTPPPNRFPIETELLVFHEDAIREAIEYELSRGGQVFFVHNRVQNIMDIAALIEKLVPRARVAVGHGQMDGEKLEEIMLRFIDGHFDVLLSTTIIESGLDIPNANTIIINDAHHFGLSDLHQLRGRVGRSNVKAFCYLLAPPLSLLTEDARKRLKAIAEFSDLGSGFNIAMRDLDIRGAGNILGAEQSGFISEIGYEMYQKILDEAMQELKTTEFKDLYKEELADQPFVRDCHIETDLEILFPESYIENISERLLLYKELDSIETEDGLLAFEARLTDRFGPVPPQVKELLNIVRLRRLATKIGIEKMFLREGKLTGYFLQNPESDYFSSPVFTSVLHFIRDYPGLCRMKESKDKLSITLQNVSSAGEALQKLAPLMTP